MSEWWSKYDAWCIQRTYDDEIIVKVPIKGRRDERKLSAVLGCINPGFADSYSSENVTDDGYVSVITFPYYNDVSWDRRGIREAEIKNAHIEKYLGMLFELLPARSTQRIVPVPEYKKLLEVARLALAEECNPRLGWNKSHKHTILGLFVNGVLIPE